MYIHLISLITVLFMLCYHEEPKCVNGSHATHCMEGLGRKHYQHALQAHEPQPYNQICALTHAGEQDSTSAAVVSEFEGLLASTAAEVR